MATGTLITESLRSGATLHGPPITVRRIERITQPDVSAEQREAGIPTEWTLLHFEVADGDAPRLADALAAVLGPVGWYVDLHTEAESFVVFAGRVFRYRRDDRAGRAAAEDHARANGVPEPQIDWP